MSWTLWIFDSKQGAIDRLIPRWIFLRALGLIYFSAFYSLAFQIKGLMGPEGILPADDYLEDVARAFPSAKFWFAPTLLWNPSDGFLGSEDFSTQKSERCGLKVIKQAS